MNFTAFRSPQRAHDERLAKAALGVTRGIRTAFLSLRRHPPAAALIQVGGDSRVERPLNQNSYTLPHRCDAKLSSRLECS